MPVSVTKKFINKLLDVDTHFTGGYYTSDNILSAKGNQVHSTLLLIVLFFSTLFTFISYAQHEHFHSLLCLAIAVFSGISLLLHKKGYTLFSKLLNFTQLIFFISLLFYIPDSTYGIHANDSVLAFNIPLIIGTLIAFQGKDRNFGYILAALILVIMSTLLIWDRHYIVELDKDVITGTNYDMVINATGATVVTFIEVVYILALNNRLNKSLIKTNHELDNFVYIISHDLRSPILATKGLLDLATLKIDDKEQLSRYIGLAGKSINNLDQIIREILAYSRNARTSLILESFDVRNTVQEITAGLRIQTESSFEFRENYSGDPVIYTDKGRLSTILRNLISNAVNYRKKRAAISWVQINIENTGEFINVTIEDNGEGIPEASIKHVFDMFYRGTSSSQGSGLGLYICREMFEKMKAQYTIQSVQGTGTTFYFSIPVVPHEPGAHQAAYNYTTGGFTEKWEKNIVSATGFKAF